MSFDFANDGICFADLDLYFFQAQAQINMECLIEAVKATKPSLKMEERLNYEKM